MSRDNARRGLLVRGLIALGVLVASAFLLLTTDPRLGLDLRGGTQIVLEAKGDSDAADRSLEVLRRRVDALGVAEPVIARSGENRIVVELPGVQDPEEAVKVLGRTAQLLVQRNGQTVMTGEGISDASAVRDQQGAGFVVNIQFQGEAPAKWQKVTGEAACEPPGTPGRQIAFVLDGKPISSPEVSSDTPCGAGQAGGATTITGRFSQPEAKELALVIRSGALPVPVEVIEQRTVGATLGAEAIDASAKAAIIGIALTSLFLIFAYRLAGVLAVVALAGYAGVAYAGLLAVGATLTLPGLAGFVLAIGMAVDANVLIFERAREEYARKPNLRRAAESGFRGALSAIADSNVTTLLAAGLLFWLATGPVRGFGVTLTIGVLASMFSALVLSRVLVLWVLGTRFVSKRPRLSGLHTLGWVRQRLSVVLYRRPSAWLISAGVLVLVAFAGLFVRGLNLGVEFTGGRMLDFTAGGPVDPGRVRTALADGGFGDVVVSSSGNEVSLRTGPINDADSSRIGTIVSSAVDNGARQSSNELIGPSLSSELRRNAVIGLAIAVAAQLAYLAVRFDWRLGLATVAALVSDVLVLIGVFAWMGKTADGVFLAALLTVIGYSVNDSVVVFDRLRSLRGSRLSASYPDLVSDAVVQTVPRTVNTGIGVLFVLSALLVLGDGSLANFATALLIGLIAGTLSTVVTAAPVAMWLESRWPRRAVSKKRTAGVRA
ncbi:protein translocase subunit secF /protein translocase subunit secD [Lentzea atacamensis]|uniref:Multifunctional fusion protein n=1 Tax=Lentzea atacamensis TaxID=531938 RepID=A0A316HQ19_9PSEU|nr:protein translocase subunit secF /protein translocase subunit secD [Lentzea atacamensis]